MQDRLIVSFHDLAPPSREACDRFLRKAASCGVNRISLLTVPQWHAGPLFTEDRHFVSWLKGRAAEGHEIVLHGYCHCTETLCGGPVTRLIGHVYTAEEGEFFQVAREEAERKLQQGLSVFGQAGVPIYGFTPPAWLLSKDGRGEVRKAGFHYTTTINHIELMREGRRIFAPVLVFSSRSRMRRFISRTWVRLWYSLHRRRPILRLAVHPLDLEYPDIEASLFRLLEWAQRSRIACTYRDILSREALLEPLTPQ